MPIREKPAPGSPIPARDRGRQSQSYDMANVGPNVVLATSNKRLGVTEIKRDIFEKVRNDWKLSSEGNLCNVVLVDATSEEGMQQLQQSGQAEQQREEDDEEEEEDPKWMVRDFSSPCPSPDGPANDDQSSVREKGQKPKARDLIDLSEEDFARYKRLQRRERLEAEMRWNAGLRYWMAQRDAWAGARIRWERHRSPSPAGPSRRAEKALMPAKFVVTTSGGQPVVTRKYPVLFSEQNRPVDVIEEVYHAPPLWPASHYSRIKFGPRSYREVYTKFVVQSNTPNAPVNLADLIKVLVFGWHEDGTWPIQPTSTPLQPAMSLAAVKQLRMSCGARATNVAQASSSQQEPQDQHQHQQQQPQPQQ